MTNLSPSVPTLRHLSTHRNTSPSRANTPSCDNTTHHAGDAERLQDLPPLVQRQVDEALQLVLQVLLTSFLLQDFRAWGTTETRPPPSVRGTPGTQPTVPHSWAAGAPPPTAPSDARLQTETRKSYRPRQSWKGRCSRCSGSWSRWTRPRR